MLFNRFWLFFLRNHWPLVYITLHCCFGHLFVPLVESGICLLVDVATLSTIYDVRHPLLLPPGYPTQVLISRPQAVRPPSSTPILAAVLRCWRALLLLCNSFLQSLSTYVRTPTPHSILRFRPAPQTPDLHTSNLPLCSARWIWHLFISRRCYTVYDLRRQATATTTTRIPDPSTYLPPAGCPTSFFYPHLSSLHFLPSF